MQEFSDSIKKTNLRIMGIEEGDEVQAKVIHNIFNETITGNIPNLKKFCTFKYRKPPGYQTYLIKIEPLYSILSLKQLAQRTEKKY
jgi:oligoribonuclease NrnB/cAMP/cGMP phosphodiesterase (DHH superfamily)